MGLGCPAALSAPVCGVPPGFPEVDLLYERMFRAEADLRSVTSGSLTGIRVVRAFGRQRREIPVCPAQSNGGQIGFSG